MNSEERPNPRPELSDLIEQQGENSLENCNWEFLGYQHALQGTMPRQDLAHLAAYQKGYLSARDYLPQQELEQNPSSGNRQPDFLAQLNQVEQDLIPQLERLIRAQGLSRSQNCQLELLGFQDGVLHKQAQPQLWSNFAYQKGYITGTNRFWHRKFASFPLEGEEL